MSSTSPTCPPPPAPDSFVRNPHKLVAYIVPFPQLESTPTRFLVYTPPPPPLLKPEKWSSESPGAKLQRHWQEEVRAAHSKPERRPGALGAALSLYAEIRGAVTRGVDFAMHTTTSADLDFITRVPRDGEESHGECENADCSPPHPVALDEIVLIYPPLLKLTPEEMRAEFVASLLRTQSKAQRDAVIATGLLPVTAALDWALVFVGWVFGGALEIDAVWAAASIRGARTARSVVQRLGASEGELKLTFVESDRAQVLADYLLGCCHERDKRWELGWRPTPTASQVLDVIGWNGGVYEEKNADGWERTAVERDLERTMTKAAKAWDKWFDLWLKNPSKAVRR